MRTQQNMINPIMNFTPLPDEENVFRGDKHGDK